MTFAELQALREAHRLSSVATLRAQREDYRLSLELGWRSAWLASHCFGDDHPPNLVTPPDRCRSGVRSRP